MAMSTDACWVGHFCVERGIFVSNQAFLCRTMHFAVELGFLCRMIVINTDLLQAKNVNKIWNLQLQENVIRWKNVFF